MIRYIRTKVAFVIRAFMHLRLSVKIVVILLVMAVGMFLAIEVTGTPTFCNSCHIMNPYYDNWKTSSHNEVICLDCHLQPGLAGYVKGKINGMAQSVDCMVGRIGTKPNATVSDSSCLRPECHNSDKLASASLMYSDMIKFNHKDHISMTVDGIHISCGTCHSHFEGDEHFEVNKKVCFSCHFLYNKETGTKAARTGCLGCHEVPSRVIKRGMVTVDHSEFVLYKASCEDSCHKKQVEKESLVAETVCLNCHSFGKSHEPDSIKLHEFHTEGEKVECFVCHGNVSHGSGEFTSIATMMDCKNCHSETHGAQLSIYTASQHAEIEKTDRVLSPMFLTHVECNGCHIDRSGVTSGALDSFGKVARAVPEACDKCHEAGAGQKYIPFWQGKIKKLYAQVSDRLQEVRNQIQLRNTEDVAPELSDNVARAEAILKSVESDGSWGVHNFKYAEAMLLEANEIITKARRDL